MTLSIYSSILLENNLSDTKTRRQLFEILQSLHEPCPVTDLVELSNNKMNRSSVYRTVEIFEKSGIIKKVYSGWKESIELSELFRRHHHHMTCTNCGVILSFEESPALVRELQNITGEYKFTAKTHSIEFSGLCSDCSNTKASFYA